MAERVTAEERAQVVVERAIAFIEATQSGVGPYEIGADDLAAFAQAEIEGEREACASAVPTTWLDPLLTGPTAALVTGGKWGCADIERLLHQVAKRIRTRATSGGERS
jgi:hypothetical protein